MRFFIILFSFLFLLSCNSDRKRERHVEKLQEKINQRKPVRITEEQIITKAYEEARRDLKDTSVTEHQWKSFFVMPGDSVLDELWNAYKHAVENKIVPTDNVQIVDTVVIYSKPIVRNDSLKTMLVAYFPKKQLILKLTDQ